jgi:hypothetical protein
LGEELDSNWNPSASTCRIEVSGIQQRNGPVFLIALILEKEHDFRAQESTFAIKDAHWGLNGVFRTGAVQTILGGYE